MALTSSCGARWSRYREVVARLACPSCFWVIEGHAPGNELSRVGVPGVCSGYVRFFITSVRSQAVADTFDDVPNHTAPGLGTDAPMNIAHA